MKKLLIFLVLLLLPTVAAEDNYEIVGNAVQIDDDYVFISAEPHTLTESGFQTIKLNSKIYTGEINVAFGFNSDGALPRSLELYTGTGYLDISRNFEKVTKNIDGFDTWYVAKNLNVEGGVEYETRLYLEVFPRFGQNSGKYFIAIWPSTLTIQQAIDLGYFYYLDPWWQSPNYGFRYPILSNATELDIPFVINDTTGIDVPGANDFVSILNASAGENLYVYSTASGPSGTIAIANETGQQAWARVTIGGVNNLDVYPPEIVAYWHFDDALTISAADSTRFAHTGYMTNGATSTAAGRFRNGSVFDGTNDYINVTDSAILRFDSGSQDYSICSWINDTDTAADSKNNMIISKRDGNGDGWSFLTRFNTGYIWSQVNAINIIGNTSVQDGTWHFACVVVDRSGTGQIWVDAVRSGAAVAIGGEVMATTSNVTIGRLSYALDEWFNGTIDSLQIYNKTLTENEISEIYRNGIGTLTSIGPESINAAPVGVVLPANNTVTDNTTIYVNANGSSDGEGNALRYCLIWNGTTTTSCNSNGVFTHAPNTASGQQNFTVNISDGIVNTSVFHNIFLLVDSENCTTGGNDVRVVKVNLTDEENLGNAHNGTISISWEITINGSVYNFSQTETATEEMEICVDPVWLGGVLDADITYHNETSWPTSRWFIRDLTLTTTQNNATMALLVSTSATETTFFVLDASGSIAPFHIIRTQRFNFDTNRWEIMRMGRTSIQGTTIIPISQDDTLYIFVITDDNGIVLKEFDSLVVTDSEITLPLDARVRGYYPDTVNTASATCTYNNITLVLTCTATDSTALVRGYRLDVWRAGALNWTLFASDVEVGSTTTLTATLNNNDIFWYSVTTEFNDEDEWQIAADEIGNSTQNNPFGRTGFMAGSFLVLSTALVGAFAPIAAPVFMFAGFTIAGFADLIEVTSSTTIILLGVLTLVVIWRIRE